ncbi:putative short-chain dehydrogenase/reductase family protein [Dactylonectria estremocensis]|uniref:Short-chain dehydrogenase/reductase family protein n=1 Tax=Dactylonectria estremocensis TaxID=1079267 RepID=A0A9P9F0N7_9HYPO|nr:putative short-chain dehydrogenase/reductase family protein [Dactylonectria estremocensis]
MSVSALFTRQPYKGYTLSQYKVREGHKYEQRERQSQEQLQRAIADSSSQSTSSFSFSSFGPQQRQQHTTKMVSSKDMAPVTSGYLSMFIKAQFLSKSPTIPKDLDLGGKVAIVTGGNSGLGLESARHMLALGLSRLVITARSLERGQAVVSSLQIANPSAKIDVWLLEMESYQSIRALVQRCETELSRIDIAILNAGLAEVEFGLASTGHEKVMQVNYLSTMLLVILLLPILMAKSPTGVTPRVTVVNSIMSTFAKFPNRDKKPLLPSFDDMEITAWDPAERYNVSKLLGQLFLSRLADGVDPEDAVVNMVEPGLTKTGLFRKLRGVAGAIFDLIKSLTAKTAEEGAITYVDAAAVQGSESHGGFVVNCEIHPLATYTYEPKAKVVADQLWEETLDEFSFANARGILQEISSRSS